MNWNILKDENIEIASKYLYVVLCELMGTDEDGRQVQGIEFSNDELAKVMGVSKPRIYRARANLIKLDAIRHYKKFCQDTGKKIGDVYDIVE